jgi:hypothetical protein
MFFKAKTTKLYEKKKLSYICRSCFLFKTGSMLIKKYAYYHVFLRYKYDGLNFSNIFSMLTITITNKYRNDTYR